MFRRRFIQSIAGSFAAAAASQAGARDSVTYQVNGFTCVTCAVGLETLLRKQKGVIKANASYPEGIVRIEFDPGVLNDKSLRALIGEMGFTVANDHPR